LLVVGLALIVDVKYEPPLWVHFVMVAAADGDRLPGAVASGEGRDGQPAILRNKAEQGRLER
jgi:hypothetical protein